MPFSKAVAVEQMHMAVGLTAQQEGVVAEELVDLALGRAVCEVKLDRGCHEQQHDRL